MHGRVTAHSSKLYRRHITGLLVLGGALLATGARAEDVEGARRDLSRASDFRLRVSAALILGRARIPGTRADLEAALGDPHPAVRASAAAALRAYGDPDAVSALEQRRAIETAPAVQKQLDAAVATLRASGPPSTAAGSAGDWKHAKFVVQLGAMSNPTGVRGAQLTHVLETATQSHLAALPGAVVVGPHDAGLVQRARAKKVPVLGMDGSVMRLSQGELDGKVTFNARVQYVLRHMPEQSLRGMLTGGATTLGTKDSLRNGSMVVSLQDQAIEGAVASALRGAEGSFASASR